MNHRRTRCCNLVHISKAQRPQQLEMFLGLGRSRGRSEGGEEEMDLDRSADKVSGRKESEKEDVRGHRCGLESNVHR